MAAPSPSPMPLMPSLMQPPEIPPEIIEQREQHWKEMAKLREEHWEARRAERDKRYGDLRKRAEEAGMNFPESAPWGREPKWLSYGEMRKQMQGRGISLPEQPSWPDHMGVVDKEHQAARVAMQERIGEMRKMREKMVAMTPEEREAFREQRYQAMRERAASRGMEFSETPPWKRPAVAGPAPVPAEQSEADWGKYQEIIAGMSSEEREACMAMHRMHMQQRMQRAPQRMAPPQGYGRGYGYGQACGQGNCPGHGYGPRWGQWPGNSD